jgi:ribose-phosphate pyrophosphokinase
MEMLLMLDAFKRASAARLTAVIPYYGYGRQDRKDKPRVPISAKLVADLLQTAGADRVLTMDLHAAQIQGFFDIPVDHLFAAAVIIDYVQQLKLPDLVVVSPDAGGVERARAYAKRLDASLAIVDKRRDQPNVAEVHNVIGDVTNKTALVVDDMVDTAGTLSKVAEALKGRRRPRGARVLLAPRAVRARDRAAREERARQAHHHRLDPARAPRSSRTGGSWCSGSPGFCPVRSRTYTRRRRSPACSSEFPL